MTGLAIRLALGAALLAAALAAQAGTGEPAGAIAMHGEPALPPNFAHLPYVNPDAPKGGRLDLAYLGAFDSLNPYNVKAAVDRPGPGRQRLSIADGAVRTTSRSRFTGSSPRASKSTTPGTGSSSISIRARISRTAPRSRRPTSLFTFNLLKAKGRPQQRAAFGLVKAVDAPDDRTVRYDLSGGERPGAAADAGHHAGAVQGPYRRRALRGSDPADSGRPPDPIASPRSSPASGSCSKRDPNYWGARSADLERGLYNFDTIRIDYFRDATAHVRGLQGGADRLPRSRTTRRAGASEYDFPAVKDGRIVKATIPNGLPKGVSGFAFNARRPLFADPRVREALASMFDFEWINANLYAGAFQRSEGFFDDSELSSIGRPASERERALLAPFPGAVREDVMEGRWRAAGVRRHGARPDARPQRASTRSRPPAIALKGGRLVDRKGTPARLRDHGQEPRGRAARARLSPAIWPGSASRRTCGWSTRFSSSARRTRFDFDMMIGTWTASPSPGNEQRGRWSSAAANAEGAYNICRRRFARDRRDDRRNSGRAEQRRLRRRGARARPAADLRLLHRAPLLCARAVDRLFEQARPAGQDAPLRRRPRRLVAARALRRRSLLRSRPGGASLDRRWLRMGADDGEGGSTACATRMRPWSSTSSAMSSARGAISAKSASKSRSLTSRARSPCAGAPTSSIRPSPRAGSTARAYMEKKFGRDGRLKTAHDNLVRLGAEVGLPFAFDRIKRAPNTLDAHRLIRWSGSAGAQHERRRPAVQGLFRRRPRHRRPGGADRHRARERARRRPCRDAARRRARMPMRS